MLNFRKNFLSLPPLFHIPLALPPTLFAIKKGRGWFCGRMSYKPGQVRKEAAVVSPIRVINTDLSLIKGNTPET